MLNVYMLSRAIARHCISDEFHHVVILTQSSALEPTFCHVCLNIPGRNHINAHSPAAHLLGKRHGEPWPSDDAL